MAFHLKQKYHPVEINVYHSPSSYHHRFDSRLQFFSSHSVYIIGIPVVGVRECLCVAQGNEFLNVAFIRDCMNTQVYVDTLWVYSLPFWEEILNAELTQTQSKLSSWIAVNTYMYLYLNVYCILE